MEQPPRYSLKRLYDHARRVSEKARCEPTDTRTFNALRLLREDVRRLARYFEDGQPKKGHKASP